MVKSKFCLWTLLFSFLLSGNAILADAELVKDGKSDYVIVLPDDAIPAEKTAAAELQKYITQISGATLKIVSPAETVQASKKILIGQSDEIIKIIPDIDFKTLKSDQIVIKTIGDVLVLSGGRPRGALYAVYTFLEDTLGARWWTSSEEFVPEKKTINIPTMSVNYAPVISDFRQAFYRNVNTNPNFAAKLKENGYFQNVNTRPDLGGGAVVIPYPCHTFFMLLPPEKYFTNHPEWYSVDKNGKRCYENGQLCLTNKEMTETVVGIVDKLLSENKNSKYIAITPMDYVNSKCLCSECAKVEAEEGSACGPIIRFINRIGEAIAEKHPDVKIIALAYAYYQEPPQKTKCGKNIIIQFCTTGFSMCHSAYSSENKEISDCFLRWRKLNPSTNFWIWDYNAVYSDFLQPFPNYKNASENIKFYAQNMSSGITIQGDGLTTVGEFVRLRTWIISHMLWNPELDYEKLENEFLNGYYGKAAPFLHEYIRMNEKNAKDKNIKLFSDKWGITMDFLSPEIILRGSELLAKAVDAVNDDPVKRGRTDRERISLLYALTVFALDGKINVTGCKGWNFKNNTEAVDELEKRLKENKCTTGAESGIKHDIIRIIKIMRTAASDAKARGPNMHQWIRYNARAHARIVEDGESSDGFTFAIPGNTNGWLVQYQIPSELHNGNPWHCYADIRCDADADDGDAAKIGIYDANTKNSFIKVVSVKEIKGTKYKTIDLGIHELNDKKYLWVAPANRPLDQLKAVYVDRFFMVKENKKKAP